MEQMSADLTNYITHYQQLSAQTFHQVYHRYPENNEAWNTTRWNVNNEQLAIEGPPSTEALLRMQEDNQSDNDDDDLINNQGMNSGKITMQDEELQFSINIKPLSLRTKYSMFMTKFMAILLFLTL